LEGGRERERERERKRGEGTRLRKKGKEKGKENEKEKKKEKVKNGDRKVRGQDVCHFYFLVLGHNDLFQSLVILFTNYKLFYLNGLCKLKLRNNKRE